MAKLASNNPVTFVAQKRFAVLLCKLTIAVTLKNPFSYFSFFRRNEPKESEIKNVILDSPKQPHL